MENDNVVHTHDSIQLQRKMKFAGQGTEPENITLSNTKTKTGKTNAPCFLLFVDFRGVTTNTKRVKRD